jgi:hypothetical protein
LPRRAISSALDAAIAWASRQADVFGDVEFDIRPVSEAWDVGVGDQPAGLTTRRAIWFCERPMPQRRRASRHRRPNDRRCHA